VWESQGDAALGAWAATGRYARTALDAKAGSKIWSLNPVLGSGAEEWDATLARGTPI